MSDIRGLLKFRYNKLEVVGVNEIIHKLRYGNTNTFLIKGNTETDENMQRWLNWMIQNRPKVNHFSIYEDGEYCGETNYAIDTEHNNSASLDIKLFGFAQGFRASTKV
ncbi:MAG: hypothetical protein ACOYH0_03055 [Saccharofermentanales bacterium]